MNYTSDRIDDAEKRVGWKKERKAGWELVKNKWGIAGYKGDVCRIRRLIFSS